MLRHWQVGSGLASVPGFHTVPPDTTATDHRIHHRDPFRWTEPQTEDGDIQQLGNCFQDPQSLPGLLLFLLSPPKNETCAGFVLGSGCKRLEQEGGRFYPSLP